METELSLAHCCQIRSGVKKRGRGFAGAVGPDGFGQKREYTSAL